MIGFAMIALFVVRELDDYQSLLLNQKMHGPE